jgi:hypothetical protein
MASNEANNSSVSQSFSNEHASGSEQSTLNNAYSPLETVANQADLLLGIGSQFDTSDPEYGTQIDALASSKQASN